MLIIKSIFGVKPLKFVIVTGMSGAGKTTVLKFLEDIGFFCADNLPPSLIPTFAEVCSKAGAGFEKVAVGIDIRGGRLFNDLLPALEQVNEASGDGFEYKILFLDASDSQLVMRYKETRRSHPLAKNDRVEAGIELEREFLTRIKERATYIIDTTRLLARELKEQIVNIFNENKSFDSLIITVLSFGFKYGIPSDSDLIFDVRFLPNPFYIPELRELTGNDKPVSDYVMESPIAVEFLDKLKDMVEFLIPHYIEEGKNGLVISVGCTGGKHRSITLANELYKALKAKGHSVLVKHRDTAFH